MTRWAFFGGSFDPPHLSHTLSCLWALETGQVDRVLMMVVANHAFGKEHGASFHHRLAMCRLATARLGDAVVVSDMESRREGTTYTVDTLRELRAEHPQDTFRLLIGSDIIPELAKWRDGEEVQRLAPILELPRPLPGESLDSKPGALPPISSSQIRENLRQRADCTHLLSRSVIDYIESERLYL